MQCGCDRASMRKRDDGGGGARLTPPAVAPEPVWLADAGAKRPAAGDLRLAAGPARERARARGGRPSCHAPPGRARVRGSVTPRWLSRDGGGGRAARGRRPRHGAGPRLAANGDLFNNQPLLDPPAGGPPHLAYLGRPGRGKELDVLLPLAANGGGVRQAKVE